jgi:hypothetical protein
MTAAALLLLALPGRVVGAPALVQNSPFAPSSVSSGTNEKRPAEDFELAGATLEGGVGSVCIFERQAKKSEWIAVGGDSDNIHVVSYDPNRDSAVVTISGVRRELQMREAVVAAAAQSGPVRPGASAVASDAAATATQFRPQTGPAAARDQREARMLVSDLLEIGVQQRKAYQDAKLKAARPPSATPALPSN